MKQEFFVELNWCHSRMEAQKEINEKLAKQRKLNKERLRMRSKL